MLLVSITSFTFYASTDVQAASNSKRVFLYVGDTGNGNVYPKFNTTDIDKFTNIGGFVILPTPLWEV
ncbi:hypothetical protein U2I54_27890 [Bacillus pseudomycoides]|uniref:Uncharacterized protein n=1 Tax=Bacillus bingmayongensis TaxID=1150157 RepID=A0ABU5K4Q6_9BACI|nr:hypothetical protein [Bacillus pseudomycoides]